MADYLNSLHGVGHDLHGPTSCVLAYTSVLAPAGIAISIVRRPSAPSANVSFTATDVPPASSVPSLINARPSQRDNIVIVPDGTIGVVVLRPALYARD